MDIKLIPIDELKKDRQGSIDDIVNCTIALGLGVENYSGGDVKERLDINRKIVIEISKELDRRGD